MTKKDIPGFASYFATEDGEIWSFRLRNKFQRHPTWKQLRLSVLHGYSYVTVIDEAGNHYGRRVHRLILETFVGPCPVGMHACHGNGIRSDNRLSNLRWGTAISNQADKRIHGTNHGGVGERNRSAKLNASVVAKIRREYANNPESIAVIAKRYGMTDSPIRCLLARKTWTHVDDAEQRRELRARD